MVGLYVCSDSNMRFLGMKKNTLHPDQSWSDEAIKENLDTARNYIKRGSYMHTLIKDHFLKAIYQIPWNVDLLLEFADYLSTREEFENAEGLYRRVLQINPDHKYAIR